jgi:hypothetical protein
LVREEAILEFVLGTILGTFLGAFFGHIVPQAVTARTRARRTARHIRWVWQDFEVFVNRRVRTMTEELARAKRDLARRGVLQSGEALSARESNHRCHRESIEDEWRKTSHHVHDMEAQLGLIARPWFDIDKDLLSDTGQERILGQKLEQLEEAAARVARRDFQVTALEGCL